MKAPVALFLTLTGATVGFVIGRLTAPPAGEPYRPVAGERAPPVKPGDSKPGTAPAAGVAASNRPGKDAARGKADLPAVLLLPPEQRRLVLAQALDFDLTVSSQIKELLQITPEEKAAINEKTKKVREEIRKWEEKNAELIPNTNILKIPAMGEMGKRAMTELSESSQKILGEDRAAFFQEKSASAWNILTGRAGETAKVVRVSLRTDEDGKPLTENRYVVEEKVLNKAELLTTVDWTKKTSFDSDSISNNYRSLYFSEVPSEYKHLIQQ